MLSAIQKKCKTYEATIGKLHFKLGAPLTLPKSNKKSFVEGRKKSFIHLFEWAAKADSA